MASALWNFSFAVWVIIVLLNVHGQKCCMENERKALLDLKDYVNSLRDFPGPDVFPSWTNDTKNDCCRWSEIRCNLSNGRVFGISLYTTDESDNSFLLNLSLLHPFEELRRLKISFGFAGWFDPIEGYKSLRRLRKLEIVDLTFSDTDNSILPFLSAATSLKTLIIRDCYLEGSFPREIKELRNLEVLDLSFNYLNGSLPGLANLHKLKALDLSDNMFIGSLEGKGLCELKNLQELDLGRNKFIGSIPTCFGGLSKLVVLDLSENHLNGSLPFSISNLRSLEFLSLSGNSFASLISLSPLTNLSKLKVFKLSSKSGLLKVESEQGLWQPKFQLNVIELPYCNLGEIPGFLKYQRELVKVDFSNNKLFEVFPVWLLENNRELSILLLGSNALTKFQLPRLVHNLKLLVVSANNFVERLPENIGQILPNIELLNLSHNGFRGTLPASLGEMRSMKFLDLSNNYFSGNLPRNLTMGCHSLVSLLLSQNNLSGQIFQKPTNLTSLEVLKMDNNLLTGTIGDGLRNSSKLSVIDLSNNHLTGEVPRWIGTLSLFAIYLANNSLEGKVHVSLFNTSLVALLDLSGNRLFGSLPPRFIAGNSELNVYLHDNDLTGVIPNTILENVKLLDLRFNNLSGSIPQFLHADNISILLLRGNNLTGHIPTQLCFLTKVILLDLAYNRLNGSIPSCLHNLSFGPREDEERQDLGGVGINFLGSSIYNYNSTVELDLWMDPTIETARDIEIDFAAKHRYDSYNGYMYGLDLSFNELTGEIPKELGDLQRLRALNLSHNSLSGHIAKSLANMTDLESLDLSFNRLSGPIPHEFVALHSLAVFYVSYNNLSGIIPQGGKLTTFDDSSYAGNPLLCGKPTNRNCDNIDEMESEEEFQNNDEEDTMLDMEVFYWSLAVTYVTVFVGFLLFLCFESSPRQVWLSILDSSICLARRALS